MCKLSILFRTVYLARNMFPDTLEGTHQKGFWINDLNTWVKKLLLLTGKDSDKLYQWQEIK